VDLLPVFDYAGVVENLFAGGIVRPLDPGNVTDKPQIRSKEAVTITNFR
jgi:hypothetical protein